MRRRGRTCSPTRPRCYRATTGIAPAPRRSPSSRRPRVAGRDSIAIIIVTFNSVEEIDACLESLVGHTKPFPTTITVVDNASADATAQHVRERWPSVHVIESGGNIGFAKANNIGIRGTDSEYVLLI